MKKSICTLLVIAALAVAGCNSKPKTEAPSGPAPQTQVPAPGQPAAGSDPHAGVNMKAQELPAGAGVKAKVSQTMNSGGYTYVEAADDKGQKVWLALPQMKVTVGDAIEYPKDAMPMTNFQSKTLNRTFDKILFVPGIKVVK
ncbi:MAG: hypothetical protein WCP33_00480 [Deltaproteobacteria bacterium]